MPRTKITIEQEANAILIGAVSRGQMRTGTNDAMIAQRLGCSLKTVGRRKSKPGDFTLSDIRNLARYYGWTDDEILGMVKGELK